MSILIKGIDMPESCYECAYSIERVGICSITQGGCEWGHNRPPHCPLIEIPTPHGRLIDADALFEAMGLDTVKEVMFRNWKFTTAWGVPIIEAEE